jgi:pimeloyl-ACP methyl ester carboxylesterase
MTMKYLKGLAIMLLAFLMLYLAGPRPAKPEYSTVLPEVPSEALALEQYIRDQESQHAIKPNNEARIVWANDSLRTPTEYALVYLHGFSASQMEGDPVHRNLAAHFGMNLYLSRLQDHGIDTTVPLGGMTAQGLWESAVQALAIGKKLGKKVILMSTSTGGTLSLKLAAEFPEIAGQILLSPNIEINDNKAWLLNDPWGLQIAQAVAGTYRIVSDTTAIYARYWNNRYLMTAPVELEQLLETTMKRSVFERITTPVLMLYYYKNEREQDPVVKISAMKRMYGALGTPDSLKRELALPNTGDHVLASPIKSKDVASVEKACIEWGAQVLRLSPVAGQ